MMYATLDLGLKNGKEITCEFGARAQVVGEGEESRLQSFIVWTVSSFSFGSETVEEKGSGMMTDLRAGLGSFEGSDARLARRSGISSLYLSADVLPISMIHSVEIFGIPCYIQPMFFSFGATNKRRKCG
jgi:hypothetical protein